MTEYEKQIMRESAYELYKAIKLLKGLDCNLGMINTMHYSIISSCTDMLNTVAEDMYVDSKE